MRSLLVLAPHPRFADEVRAAVKSLDLRVVHRLSVEEAEPLLVHELATICIVELEPAGVQGVWVVERILRRAPHCSVVAFVNSRNAEWEEELYLAGVRHIFSKPVRERLLVKTLKSLVESKPKMEVMIPNRPPVAPWRAAESEALSVQEDSSLMGMRRFSEILTHSLDTDGLMRQFVTLLRETMGINRVVVFLDRTFVAPSENPLPEEHAWMKMVCVAGVSPTVAGQLMLSPDSGIGGTLAHTGRILHRYSLEPEGLVAQREFDLVGAEVAVPIMARHEMAGIVLLDRKVTGRPLANSELETAFHLLEQVGQAMANIRMHDQLVGSNQLLGDVLKELNHACLVVGPDLVIRHANKAVRRLVGTAGRRSGDIEFGELPEVLGAKIYQVLQTGAALPPFRYETEAGGKSIYSVSVAPVQSSTGPETAAGHSVLMVAEDRTQAEQMKTLEVETANLRLVSNMADRLAAEIGNAIVPLSVHFQLFDERIKEAEFRKSLKSVMGDSVKRVSRLASQMRFIYGNSSTKLEDLALGKVLDEANDEAKSYFPSKEAVLEYGAAVREARVFGSRNALKHSFSEIILNGYQSNPAGARIQVRLLEGAKANGGEEVGLEFEDSGEGFADEAAMQASQPFFTTRTAGVGLGLSAARKIVEDHGGRLEIPVSPKSKHGIVRVFLPARQHQE